MAQGYAIEVLLAAHLLTNRKEYLTTARAGANGMALPISKGGTAIVEGPGLWFEEYASDSAPPPHVLNGHNFALEGIWHLTQFDTSYRPLFDKGVIALKQHLSEFDQGIWSSYDLTGTAANRKYQKIHAQQLHKLYAWTGDPRLAAYGDKFDLQLKLPFHGFFRLFIHPTRFLCGLIALNSLIFFLCLQFASQMASGVLTGRPDETYRLLESSELTRPAA